MTEPCEGVAERLALGESLEPMAEHIAGCAACKRLIEMPRQIGAARQAVDPGLGFSARMTAGAQHKISVRRRRRLAAGLAASVAAGALGVFVVARPGMHEARTVATEPPLREPAQPRDLPTVGLEQADLAALVNYADTDRSRRLSANWDRIEESLAPYRALVETSEGETP